MLRRPEAWPTTGLLMNSSSRGAVGVIAEMCAIAEIAIGLRSGAGPHQDAVTIDQRDADDQVGQRAVFGHRGLDVELRWLGGVGRAYPQQRLIDAADGAEDMLLEGAREVARGMLGLGEVVGADDLEMEPDAAHSSAVITAVPNKIHRRIAAARPPRCQRARRRANPVHGRCATATTTKARVDRRNLNALKSGSPDMRGAFR